MGASDVTTVEEYLAGLAPERAEVVQKIRDLVVSALPDGYVETMRSMITYEIPLERYPMTYNKQPLMFAAIAAGKNNYSLHLLGVYASEPIAQQLRDAYAAADTKLDMGKSCVRFKRLDQLVPEAITEAISSVSVEDFIALYEASRPS